MTLHFLQYTYIMTGAYTMSYIYLQVVPDPSSWHNTPATITNVTTTEYILLYEQSTQQWA